jgi:uncharacterized protein YjiS (DUF1127 family)
MPLKSRNDSNAVDHRPSLRRATNETRFPARRSLVDTLAPYVLHIGTRQRPHGGHRFMLPHQRRLIMSTTFLSRPTLGRESWLARAARALGAVFEAMSRWNRRRRERDQLESFDDRMLSDIGLSRADIERVFEKSFWRF